MNQLEEQMYKWLMNYMNTHILVSFIGISIIILSFITIVYMKQMDITKKKASTEVLLNYFLSTLIFSGVIFIIITYFDKYTLHISTGLLSIFFTYSIYKKFNGIKDNRWILSSQDTLYKLTKKVNKDNFRKINQVKTSLGYFIIKKSLFNQVLKDTKFVKIFKNDMNLISKLEVLENKEIEEERIKNKAIKTKISKLSDLHKSIIDAICYSYSTIDDKKSIQRIRNKFNKFDSNDKSISRLKLDYMIFNEYEESTKVFISPMMNLMLLSESILDRELIGSLQNSSMLKLQSVGYSYYIIFKKLQNKDKDTKTSIPPHNEVKISLKKDDIIKGENND